MKNSFKSFMISGAIILGLSMCFTSCEGTLDDIFGEWSRPTGGTSTSTEKTASISFAKSTELKHFADGNFTNEYTPKVLLSNFRGARHFFYGDLF